MFVQEPNQLEIEKENYFPFLYHNALEMSWPWTL